MLPPLMSQFVCLPDSPLADSGRIGSIRRSGLHLARTVTVPQAILENVGWGLSWEIKLDPLSTSGPVPLLSLASHVPPAQPQ